MLILLCLLQRSKAQQVLKPIQFSQTAYIKDGRLFYLNSGEFPYFRVPKSDWKSRMELLKKAGGNCLATYVPWFIHEPAEGHFVFGTETYNDLEGFLKLAREEGLYVIVRPGPYLYSELHYGGLPAWLCQNYPQIQAKNFEGKTYASSSLSYQHPLFLEKVKKWYDRVCPILAKYTISHGGPIAMMQLDNELTGVHIWNKQLDYNPETMGFGKQDGPYTLFLSAKYGKIFTLNDAYGSHYEQFGQVRPIDRKAYEKVEELRQVKDYYDFYFKMAATYLDTLATMARNNGIDIPLIHNAGNPEMIPYLKEAVKTIKPPFILGVDCYYNLNQGWPQNNPTPQYITRTFTGLEMLRLMGYPASVFEMPSGSVSDWPPVTATDAKACYMSSLAFGMKGHNYYIFTGGPNPMGYGSNGNLYDYNAPVGAENQVRPLYFAQKEVAAFIRKYPWLPGTGKVHDCRIALDMEYARADNYWKTKAGFPFTSAEAWNTTIKGVFTTGMCAGISPEFCDLDNQEFFNEMTPLIVVSSSVMSQRRQQHLVGYLKQGGKVLILPVLPSLDEDFRPCTILKDFIGKFSVETLKSSWPRADFGKIKNVPRESLFVLKDIPAHTEVIGTEEQSGKAVAAKITTEGNGVLLWAGVSWTAGQNEQCRMLKYLLDDLGYHQQVYCDNPNIWVCHRSDGKHEMLFVINLFSSPQNAIIHYTNNSGKLVDLGKVSIPSMTVKTFPK
jgi:beta-galactosidase